ncbi:hypothetical protein V3C99_013041 [Haemonchus contortus]
MQAVLINEKPLRGGGLLQTVFRHRPSDFCIPEETKRRRKISRKAVARHENFLITFAIVLLVLSTINLSGRAITTLTREDFWQRRRP